MKTTTISIYKSLTLKGLQEQGRQKEFGLILLKRQISAKSPFLIISKYNFHLRHVDIKAKKFMPLKTFPISIIKKLPCYIQTPYCIKKNSFTYFLLGLQIRQLQYIIQITTELFSCVPQKHTLHALEAIILKVYVKEDSYVKQWFGAPSHLSGAGMSRRLVAFSLRSKSVLTALLPARKQAQEGPVFLLLQWNFIRMVLVRRSGPRPELNPSLHSISAQ